jgi:hypothetical protein
VEQPRKVWEKGPTQTQKAPIVRSPPSKIVKGDLAVVPTSSAPTTSMKEPCDIGSSFSQFKFPKGSRTGFYWKKGLPANFPDSINVYLSGRSKVMKLGEESLTSDDLDEYAWEAVYVLDLPYFARNIEDIFTALTTAMDNIF